MWKERGTPKLTSMSIILINWNKQCIYVVGAERLVFFSKIRVQHTKEFKKKVKPFEHTQTSMLPLTTVQNARRVYSFSSFRVTFVAVFINGHHIMFLFHSTQFQRFFYTMCKTFPEITVIQPVLINEHAKKPLPFGILTPHIITSCIAWCSIVRDATRVTLSNSVITAAVYDIISRSEYRTFLVPV